MDKTKLEQEFDNLLNEIQGKLKQNKTKMNKLKKENTALQNEHNRIIQSKKLSISTRNIPKKKETQGGE